MSASETGDAYAIEVARAVVRAWDLDRHERLLEALRFLCEVVEEFDEGQRATGAMVDELISIGVLPPRAR